MAELHLVCGLVCAGKTTLARQLETSLPAVRLCPDEWIAEVLEDPDDRPEMDRLRARIESLQRELALKLLGLGTHVVLENGFWAREERLEFLQTGKQAGADVVLHFLDVPREVLLERLTLRNTNLPPGTFKMEPAELEHWLDVFEAPDAAEQPLYDQCRIHVAS